jgi:hypothetical protein
MPKKDGFSFCVRIYPDTEDIDIVKAKELLGLAAAGPEVVAVRFDDDAEMLTVEFRADPPLSAAGLQESEVLTKWQIQEFRSATRWLEGRPESAFARLRATGLQADLCVTGYWGRVPLPLMRQLVRHELPIWM